ncbi:hypothetical protein [Sphingomonas sp. PAMC 26617]|uniref:hypothetical protein n=1 Tax=Sphingomonas sp. PAMC 26617 TaxID=1112216 RepID=UPI000287F4F5|nr:hypothetical protein [Sphingomonas sp. PAMC 26617]
MTTASWWVSVLGVIAAPAAAQAVPQQPAPPTDRDIVVVGNRIPDYKRLLAACLAQGCRPDRDIAITLDLAQAQFEAGDYQDARTALLAARHRNARFAQRYPVAVANLHHANSQMAAHLGLVDSEWSSALDTISAMKAGTSDTDPRVFLERVELGDTYAADGRLEESQVQYRAVARRAHKLGLREIEALALLRIAALNIRLAEVHYESYARIASTAIRDVLRMHDPKLAPFVAQARTQQTQLALLKARGGDVDRLIAAHPMIPAGEPAVLLYAPSVSIGATGNAAPRPDAQGDSQALQPSLQIPVAMSNFDRRWIDVVFTVDPDGRVRDARVDRHGERVETEGNWAAVIVSAVAQRRYARQAEPTRARERFTFTSNWRSVTGTRRPQRDPNPRLVRALLDPDPA